MKTNTFIAAAFISLVIVYLLVLRIQPDRPEFLARFIPSTALFYIEQEDFFDSFENLTQSSLGKKFKSIDFAGVAEDIGVGEGIIADFKNLVKAITFAKSSPLLKELLGNKIALAVLPPINHAQVSQKRSDFFRDNVVVVAEPSYPASVFEMLGSTLLGASGGSIITSIQYGQHHIKRIEYDGNSFSLVRIGGIYLIAVNERQLRRCMDMLDDKQPSFANDKEFLMLKNSFPDADRLLALPLENLEENLVSIQAEFDVSSNPFFKEYLSEVAGFTAFGYAAKHQHSIVKERILIHYHNDKVDEFTKEHAFLKPVTPKHPWFSLTTENPMMYFWTNSFSLKNLLLTVSQDWQFKGKSTDTSSQLVAAAWKNLESIPHMLGEEMAVIVEPGSEDRSLRVPLAVIFLPVIDINGLKTTIQKIIDTHSIAIKTSQYGSVEYMQSTQSPQDGLLPLYGFWGDQFFLGNSASLLHKIIDTHEHGFSLLSSDLIKKNNAMLAEPNNLVTYSNNVQLIDALKDFLNIMGTLAALEDRQLAQKIRLVNDTIVTPLLDGMKMYNASITRSYFTSEHIIVDATTTISDHP